MDLREAQAKRLRKIIDSAGLLHTALGSVQQSNGNRVHFRPCSTGVAMVGLLPDRPQRGKSRFTNLRRLAAEFEPLFAKHCLAGEQDRSTPEKALQSFLIREAYMHGRLLVPLNAASVETAARVELWFVTDEIAMPVEGGGKTVCDILALRRDGGRSTPILLELKNTRQLIRLTKQVQSYAKIMDAHAELFAELYGALLGTPIKFDGPTEKWIVWPMEGREYDPRQGELLAQGIRLVGYRETSPGLYGFRVGRPPGIAPTPFEGPTADDYLLHEFTRVRIEAGAQVVEVGAINWDSRELTWTPVVRLPEGSSSEQASHARRKVLHRRKFFGVCDECGERMPRGHMEGSLCHSCMEMNHGVVF